MISYKAADAIGAIATDAIGGFFYGEVQPMPDEAAIQSPLPQFTFTVRLRSVRFAVAGIRTMLASQHNAWVHAVATAAVVIAGLVFRLDRGEWCALIFAMMAVWTAEALNTAFEFLCDVASPAFHPMVAKSKDVAAGAVLLSAIGSVAVGLIIFGPHLLRML